MSPQAVIFDWGGTCCSEGEPFSFKPFLERVGLSPDDAAAQVKSLHHDYYCGRINGEQFWAGVFAHFGIKPDQTFNHHNMTQAYLASYQVYPEMIQYARGLRSRYKVALLSNLTPEMRDHIQRQHPLRECFDVQIYSCDPDLRAMKPDPAPYLLAASKLGLPPQRCVFIDNAARNVEGARKLGMQAVLFTALQPFLEQSSAQLGL